MKQNKPVKNSKRTYEIILGDEQKAHLIIKETKETYEISDFDTTILYAEDISVEYLLNELKFLPTLSSQKLIIVKNVEHFTKKSWEPILNYLDAPFPHVFLILAGRSSKVQLRKYSPVGKVLEQTPEAVLFSSIYRMKEMSSGQLIGLIHNYMSKPERPFSVVLSAVEIYLRNKLVQQKHVDESIIKKFALLHKLDFELKTGILSPQSGFELFLYYLIKE